MAQSSQHYRVNAANLRELAASVADASLHDQLVKLAGDYDELAGRAEQREADVAAERAPATSKSPS